jgi:hypothetical protein
LAKLDKKQDQDEDSAKQIEMQTVALQFASDDKVRRTGQENSRHSHPVSASASHL